MKKWILSGIFYLILVVVGYLTYEAVFVDKEEVVGEHGSVDHEVDSGDHGSDEEDDGNHNDHSSSATESEVQVDLGATKEDIALRLTDFDGNPVDQLEVNHEKLLHLIVVSSDLETYVHLHPEQSGVGEFNVDHNLPKGEYKAFVDIKPKDLAYEVIPIVFTIGEGHGEDGAHSHLQADVELTKTVDSYTVTMEPSSMKVGEEIQLEFDLHGKTPETYLGALGHVVILDELGEEYIHVHPLEGEEPVFATSFSKPGLYKIWAEFKFNGEVFVFPFVIEIE